MIVLLATSFVVLEPNWVGIEYNPNFQQIDQSRIYEPGRHFLGPGHYFIKYPTTAERIEESIQARTHDGMKLTLKFTFNFKLRTTTELIDLYLKYGDYEQLTHLYARIARNSVRLVASNYTAFDFFPKRSEIQEAMVVRVNSDIDVWSATVENFQLQELVLPAAFEQARTRQIAAREEEQKAEYERDNARINANSLVNQARKKAEVILYNADAKAKSILLSAQADKDSQSAKLAVEVESFGNIKEALQFTDKELLSFVWVDAMKNKLSAKTLLGAGIPEVIKSFKYQ
jgi:regulator of protease activity HflC (stomatin/prohibitin superfamily)